MVDDDEMTLAILRKMVQAAGYAAQVSQSASNALALLSESSFDAIICDMWMPGMTGRELYLKLESELPQYKNRTLFITGDIASETTWNFIEERNLPYLLKPVVAADLVRKLKQLLGSQAPAPAPAPGPKEKRKGRRVAMKGRAWVRRSQILDEPEVVGVANASREGFYFLTSREYQVGNEVLVVFPYTGTDDIKQAGYVARVEKREEGRRGVAIALGTAAEAIRATLAVQKESRQGPAEPPQESRREVVGGEVVRVSDLKFRLAQARQEASFLALELVDLKAMYLRIVSEDQPPVGGKAVAGEAGELVAAKSAMNRVIEELKREIETMRTQVTAAHAGRGQKSEKL